MNYEKIEQSYERCFYQQLLAYSIEKKNSSKKKVVAAQNLQSIKAFLTLELNQYHKSGSMFSSSEPVAACSKLLATAANLETPWVCASQS